MANDGSLSLVQTFFFSRGFWKHNRIKVLLEQRGIEDSIIPNNLLGNAQAEPEIIGEISSPKQLDLRLPELKYVTILNCSQTAWHSYQRDEQQVGNFVLERIWHMKTFPAGFTTNSIGSMQGCFQIFTNLYGSSGIKCFVHNGLYVI